MPIRLNLLAEAQAAEDLRRRDPVKRGIWLAALIIAVLLVVSSFFQLWVTDHSRLSAVEAQIGSHTNAYQQVLDNRNRIAEINRKLTALRQLTTTASSMAPCSTPSSRRRWTMSSCFGCTWIWPMPATGQPDPHQ